MVSITELASFDVDQRPPTEVLAPLLDFRMLGKFTVSVVIPTLNEADNLPYVLTRIPYWVDEVILVDGNSTDETVAIAKSLYPTIRVIQQGGKGKGNALQNGFEAATGDIIVMLDADGSTNPQEISAYVGCLLAGADYAKGSRFVQGGGTSDMPLYRKLGNLGFVMSVRLLFGGQFTGLCYGYNAFWRHILPLLKLDASGFEIETLMNIRALSAGLKIAEVPSFEAERIRGLSHLQTFPDGFRVLKTILHEWLFSRPKPVTHSNGNLSLNDPFVAAMQLLFTEALSLSRYHEKLSDEAYNSAKMQYAQLVRRCNHWEALLHTTSISSENAVVHAQHVGSGHLSMIVNPGSVLM